VTGNRLWMLGVALASVAVIALGWILGISPTLAQADLASSQAQAADSQNAVQQAALVKLKGQYDKLPELSAQLKQLQLAVPETANLDDFLDQLQAIAQSTGVSITTFTAAEGTLYGGGTATAAAPAPTPTATATPAPGGTSAASGTTAPAASAGITDRLFSVPVTVAVKGTPEQVMAFTDASQKGIRFFLVTGDQFTGATSPDGGGGTLTGFVFVVHGAPAAVVPAK
jgi:hypothetical protein